MIAEKDSFVAHYANAAVAALEDPKTEEPFKNFLFFISPWIESRGVADEVCKSGSGKSQKPRHNFVAVIDAMSDDRKAVYVSVLYYFLMALSYASHDGWRLRKRFAKASGNSNRQAIYSKAAKAMSRAEMCFH
jgi:hypothetical protein